MIKTDNKEYNTRIAEVYNHSQDHIFRFWDELDERQKINLLRQVNSIDFELLERLVKQAFADNETDNPANLEAPEVISLKQRLKTDPPAEKIGSDALVQGKVAAFLVAGGQGTRLGFEGPKGMYPVTPVKKKSLFQLHAEKLLAIGQKYGKQIPWYIMTSVTNDIQTKNYFKENEYFGYDSENISFFTQDMIPAIDRQGKLILDQPDHIFMNPNGHGGSINALWKSGSLKDMKNRGVDYVFYFQVDNVLTHICDPVYVGYHIQQNSEMSCKVVRKKSPEEKMGVLCMVNGRLRLIEYSDMSLDDMHALNSEGSLKLWAGNIATHIFDRRFLEKENEQGFKLPYHLAQKSIPYLDQSGSLIKPDEKNGIKFETFVFDALADAERIACIEVERQKEFSPLKNKEGDNSPATVRNDLIRTYQGWLKAAGQTIPESEKNQDEVPVEISPLISLRGENLNSLKTAPRPVEDGIYIG